MVSKIRAIATKIVLVVVLSGCGSMSISTTNPQPILNLTQNSNTTLRLDIDQGIQDAFEVKAGGVTVFVSGYRTSLENGFRNGFQDYYKVVAPNSDSDLKVNLTRADFNLGQGLAIAYSANLSKNDKIVKRSTGRIEQKGGTNPDDATKQAIEKMYEAIAKDLFP